MSYSDFEIEDGVLKGYNGCDNEVLIPFGVTKIAKYAFAGFMFIKKIIISDGVTEIEEHAFDSCFLLEEIILPDSIEKIHQYAFYECISLEKITIPKNLKIIEKYSFSGCTLLNEIKVLSENQYFSSEEGVLFNKNKSILFMYPEGKTKKIYYVPDSVKIIEKSAFRSCEMLKKIILSEATSEILDCAFGDCISLKEITISGNVRLIEKDIFYNCRSLKQINVSPENQYFSSENGVLFSKDKTKLIKCPEKNQNSVYYIPNSVVEILDSAFENCKNIKEIIIPNSVKKIKDNAFWGCASLKKINISDNVKELGDGIFVGCKMLEKITVPKNVRKIGKLSFIDCFSLKEINVSPDNKYYSSENGALTSKDGTLLIKCPAKIQCESYSVSEGITKIDIEAFNDCCFIKEINIPDSVKLIEEDSFLFCSSLKKINVSPENKRFSSVNGVLFSKNGFILIKYPEALRKKIYSVPENVKEIKQCAFMDCKYITEIIIPDSVKKINQCAFSRCKSLKKIYVSGKLDLSETDYPENCEIIYT